MNDTIFKPSKQEKVLNLNSKSKSLFTKNSLNTVDTPKLDLDQLGDLFLLKYDILVNANSEIFLYSNPIWKIEKKDYLVNLSGEFDHPKHTTTKRRNETVNNAISKRTVGLIEWNSNLTIYEIPCKNGMLDFTTDIIRPHKRDDLIDYIIPHNYNPNATCPRWLQCLDEWFGIEENKKLLLQEFFGYIISSGCNLKKALWLVGANDTGKSKVVSVISKLIGPNGHSSISMADMDDPRKRSPIKNKKANLMYDEPINCEIASGGFKMIVSGESVEIDIKYEPNGPYTPTCKLVAAMNELPTMRDSTDAVITRLLLIKFNNKIDQIDENLAEKLNKEMEGILAWSIKGLKRRMETHKWTEIPESIEILRKYKIEQSPILYFLETCDEIERDPNSFMTCTDFIDLFMKSTNNKYQKRSVGGLMTKAGFPSSHTGKERIYRGFKRIFKTSKTKEANFSFE